MKYITYDIDGNVTGHYDDAIHGARSVWSDPDTLIPNPETLIPLEALLITDAQYQLSVQGLLRVDFGSEAILEIEAQPTQDHELIDGQWVLNLTKYSETIIGKLNSACRDACEAGHTSDAVGSKHFYATDGYGQINLLGHHLDAMANTADPAWTQKITCTPEGETTSTRVAHTAAQTLGVTVPAKQMIEDNRTKYNTKKHYILTLDPASPTIEADIAAVTWESVEE